MSNQHQLEIEVDAARKLLASEFNSLDPAVYRVEERISLGEVIFTIFEHDIELGRLILKPRIGKVNRIPLAEFSPRFPLVQDDKGGVSYQPGDEERFQILKAILGRVRRGMVSYSDILAVQQPRSTKRKPVHEPIERPKSKPGPKRGALAEDQKETVRRYREAKDRGETQKPFCAREGIERSSLRRWEKTMEQNGEL